ncbi:MAG: hypothetical protein ABIG40_02635 [Parcubacteria group bacterium]
MKNITVDLNPEKKRMNRKIIHKATAIDRQPASDKQASNDRPTLDLTIVTKEGELMVLKGKVYWNSPFFQKKYMIFPMSDGQITTNGMSFAMKRTIEASFCE